MQVSLYSSTRSTLTDVQIVYTCVVGLVMLAAFFEWVLWLAAFLHCFVKVYQKAENLSTKVLSIIMMKIFLVLRYLE